MSSRFIPGNSLRHQHFPQHDIFIDESVYTFCLYSQQRSQQMKIGKALRMLILIGTSHYERWHLCPMDVASAAQVITNRGGPTSCKQASTCGVQVRREDFMHHCTINCNAVHLIRQASCRAHRPHTSQTYSVRMYARLCHRCVSGSV